LNVCLWGRNRREAKIKKMSEKKLKAKKEGRRIREQ
jgi:hypothetical protein